jgi:glycosyltransferase involved in cell wall biosynthesis
MQSRKVIVGINSTGYNETRNIIVPTPDFAEVRKTLDLMKMIDFAYFKIRKKNHLFFHNTYLDAGFKNFDLLHFYNTVSLGKRPWIVTYENDVPRHNPDSRYLLKKLAGDACKQIIAMTQNAFNIESAFLDNYPDLKDKILAKITILPPPQKLYVEEKKLIGNEKIQFTFVGGAFFHKGGKEMLLAFIRALQEVKNIHLNIVSAFAFTYWYDSEYSSKDILEMKQIMSANNEHITYHASLPNDKIIELFKNSHVGLLPSFGETYGYSVLEAQACGCPVITNNSWAFPEFNSNESGWLLDLPTSIVKGGLRSDIGTAEKKAAFSKLMIEKLVQTILHIASNPGEVETKSAKAIENIRCNHSVEKHRAILADFYLKAIS